MAHLAWTGAMDHRGGDPHDAGIGDERRTLGRGEAQRLRQSAHVRAANPTPGDWRPGARARRRPLDAGCADHALRTGTGLRARVLGNVVPTLPEEPAPDRRARETVSGPRPAGDRRRRG